MVELLSGFDWLGEQVTDTGGRVLVTMVAAAAFLVVLLSYRRLERWLESRLRPIYIDVLVTAVIVGTTVLTVGVVLGVWQQTGDLDSILEDNDLGAHSIARAAFSFVLIVSAFILTRFSKRIVGDLLGSSHAVTDHQREVTHRITQVSIWAITLLVVLSIWIEDPSGLLVGAGFFGIVVGMAARQTLGSVLAGFVLMFARPFEVGDWIEMDDYEGTVTDISIVTTRVQSFDGEYVMIPNDVIRREVVVNRSKKDKLRIEVDVGVDYESNIETASTLAEDAVGDLAEVTTAPEPQVVTKEFGDSAVLLGVRFWIDRPNMHRRWEARTAAIGAIKRMFDEEGIGIPYPQRELSGRGADSTLSFSEEGRKRKESTGEPEPHSGEHE